MIELLSIISIVVAGIMIGIAVYLIINIVIIDFGIKKIKNKCRKELSKYKKQRGL